jgi:hypothetical protein
LNDEGIISVDLDPDGRTERLQDGREFYDAQLLLTEEAHDRIRLGYQCGRCMQLFSEAWPEQCLLCGFPVATIQREFYERVYAGKQMLRTSLTQQELADGERALHEALKERRR